MTSIFNRRGKYPQEEKQKPTNINNSNMYRPKKLSFQTGGANGYDAIHPDMYNQMQGLYNQNMVQMPMTQEQMSLQGSLADQQYVNQLAKQNKKIGKQLLPSNAYDYLMKQNSPQVQRYTNPQYMYKNQMYQEGGPIETQQMEQPGQEQQIMQMVAQALQQGTPPEQVMQMLVEQGIPQEQAQQIIQEVMSQMQGQMSPQQPTNVQPQGEMEMGGMRPKGLSYDY